MTINRRDLLGTGTFLAVTAAGVGAAHGQSASSAEEPGYSAATLGKGLTTAFAKFLAGMRYEDLSQQAVHEAERAVLDWLGCALAGSTHPTVKILLSTLSAMGSAPTVTVIGQRGRKLGLQDAPIINGQMGHVLDFDDTHLGGVILHTSTATLPALLAIGERQKASGRDLIVSLAAGFEAGIRTGQAAPRHHRGGWHLTGTLGTIAAGAASGRLVGLDAQQMTHALGIACTQAAGMQQNRGTDCKSLHAGKAAYHGVLAAMLAKEGFNSSTEILEGSSGFTKIYSTTQNEEKITEGLGKSWIITGNGYKPYACGVVLHPLIDAMIQVSRENQVPAQEVTQAVVKVHPDVVRITGVDNPGSGLMSKFSANHAAAVAYVDRAGGMLQFTKERADDPVVQTMRKLIKIQTEATYRLDEAEAVISTRSGVTHIKHVDHASGTVANPMSDAALLEKFMGNAVPVVGQAQATRIATMVSQLRTLDDVGELMRACA